MPGDDDNNASFKAFSPRPQRSSCSGSKGQYISGLIHKLSEGFKVTPSLQTGTSDPLVVPWKIPLSESTLHPWAPECGGRYLVEEEAEAGGMETASQEGAVDLEEVQPS